MRNEIYELTNYINWANFWVLETCADHELCESKQNMQNVILNVWKSFYQLMYLKLKIEFKKSVIKN